MVTVKTLLKNERGVVMVISLLILALLVGAGVGAIVSTQTDLKTSGNVKVGAQAFYTTVAGVNHAWEEMADGDGTNDFAAVFSTTGTTTLFNGTTFGSGSYTVTAKAVSGSVPNRIKVTSTGCLPAGNPCPTGNSKAVIEAQFDFFDIGPLPGTITLIGSGANFTGAKSGGKSLSGDEASGCGTDPSQPVIAVTDGVSEQAVQLAVNQSKPNTYSTSFAGGKVDDIVASGQVSSINSTYGFDYTNVGDLKTLVDRIEKSADSVVSGGATGVDVGSPGDEKIVVVNGDYTLNATDGAGILVVKGILTFRGDISFTGTIVVIGTGVMQRSGGGSGTIKGGIIIANIVGPDGVYGTSDDILGSSPTLDTSGGGGSDILYCSTAVDKSFSELVDMVTWQEEIS